MEPAVATELCFGCAVERVKAYPKTAGVGSLYQRAQPVHLRRRPLPGVRLAAGLDHLPWIVPPAPVVCGFHRIHYLGRRRRILSCGMNGAEEQQTSTRVQLIVEHGLLR